MSENSAEEPLPQEPAGDQQDARGLPDIDMEQIRAENRERAQRHVRITNEGTVLSMMNIYRAGARRLEAHDTEYAAEDVAKVRAARTAEPERTLTDDEQDRRDAVDTFFGRLTEPVDPREPDGYLEGLSADDLALLSQGLDQERHRLSDRIYDLREPQASRLVAHLRQMRENLVARDTDHALDSFQYLHKVPTNFGPLDTSERDVSPTKSSPRGGLGWRRPVAAVLLAGGAFAATMGLVTAGEGGSDNSADQIKVPTGYELIVANPEQAQKSFADFRSYIHETLSPEAAKQLDAKFGAILPSQLAEHFIARAIINEDGERTGTELNFWFAPQDGKDITQSLLSPDLKVTRDYEPDIPAATITIGGTIGPDGSLVKANSDVHILTSDERHKALAQVVDVTGNYVWDVDKSTPTFDVGSITSAKENVDMWPTNFGIGVNGDFSVWKRTKVEPDRDATNIPLANTDIGRAAQAVDIATQAEIPIAGSASEDGIDHSKALLALAASVEKQIADHALALQTQKAIDAVAAQVAAQVANESFSTKTAQAAGEIANTIQDPNTRTLADQEIASAAVTEAGVTYSDNNTEIGRALVKAVGDPALAAQAARDIDLAVQAVEALKDPTTDRFGQIDKTLDTERQALTQQAGKANTSLFTKVTGAFRELYDKALGKKN